MGGEMTALYCGEYRQMIYVVEGGSRAQILYECISSSPLLRSVRNHGLYKSIRLVELQRDTKASKVSLSFTQYLL